MRDYKNYYNGEFSNYDGANVDDFIEENEIATIDDNNVSEDTTYSSSKIEGLVSGGTGGSCIDDDQTSTGTTYSSSKIETLISGITGTTYTAGDGIDITNNVISLISEINDLEVSSASTYSSSKIISILTGIGFSVVVVDELPGTGDTKTIYLVKHSGGWFRSDYYEEYIFILDDEPGHWELIGTTKIDLSEYYKKTEVDGLLDTKSNIDHAHEQYSLTSHTHSEYSLTGHTHDQYSLTGHTHEINEVGELQTALDSKSNTGHTHDQYSLTSHTHIISDVEDLQDTLNSKSNTGHTHVINDIDELQAALDSKSNTGHTHDQYSLTSHTHEQYSLTGHTHTASEVGALPDTTVIPSKTSDLTNDSGFITGYTAGDGIQISANTISVINDFLPIGSITMWATATPPTGWLICNGQSITASTYSILREVLNADIVPDLTGRFPLGANSTYTIGDTGGTETVTLTKDQIPTHNHEIKSLHHKAGTASTAYRTFNLNSMATPPDAGDIQDLNPTDYTENTGGGQPHNNMPPYFALNFIIKYK